MAIAKTEAEKYTKLIDYWERKIDEAILKRKSKDTKIEVFITPPPPQQVGREIQKRFQEKGWTVGFKYYGDCSGATGATIQLS